MNPIVMWCNFCLGFLGAMAPRKDSDFGLPEPLETFFVELNADIRRAQDEIAHKIAVDRLMTDRWKPVAWTPLGNPYIWAREITAEEWEAAERRGREWLITFISQVRSASSSEQS